MAETPSQKDVFLNTEGDQWFRRNRLIQDHESSIPYDVECMLDFCSSPEILPMNRILEIGCSDGYKLSLLTSKLRSEGYGVDPSTKAVEHGMVAHRESNIKLMVGTADELPFDDNYFDLVFVGFCLYLVDRDLLQSTILSIDRVLRNGGVLAITDFDVNEPIVKKYHHIDGMYTYKCDYSEMFARQLGYHLALKASYSHKSRFYTIEPDERIAISIMYKK